MKNRYCPECGRSIPLDAKICPYCAKMIPMHEGQIVDEPGEKKDKTVIIIIAVIIILLIVPMAIAATVYVYISGQIGPSPGPFTPTIACHKTDESTLNTLTILSIDPKTILWEDIELQVNRTAKNHGMSGLVSAEDTIDITSIAGTGEYSIVIRHLSTNTLIYECYFYAPT